jgi:two-component system phosphate regulon sensor histidine kinase PhoR
MGRRQYWAIIILGVTTTAVTGAIGTALGVGSALGAVSSGVLGIGAALLAGRALGGVFQTARGSQTAPQATTDIEAGMGRELLGDLPLALALLDRNGRVRFLNEMARRLFGPVAAGEPLSSMARARPLADAVSAVAAGGRPITVEFNHMRARDQRVLLAHVRFVDAHPAREGAHLAREETGIMILIEDHTRSAKIEQMRRDFIANASHELKTPLASIAGFIETLQGPAAGDPEARARFLPVMAAQAERMKRLVEDLMSLNRIEMNEHMRPSTNLDLGVLLRDAVAATSPVAQRAGHSIVIELPASGPNVIGDRDELSQLFINLIDNAIKYGGDAGPVRIHLAPDEPGRRAMVGISVTDLGPGIERQHIPRLTERFYRVSDSRSRAKGGTGLGLSIVKHILNRHRGDLTIRSKPEEGACFTAWLPRKVEPSLAGES